MARRLACRPGGVPVFRLPGDLITDRVRAVAAVVRVTEATARTYLDDETVKDMARRMLFEFAGEQPGADLLQVPRTVRLPLVLVGMWPQMPQAQQRVCGGP
jgi:hypothetical protein